MSNKLKNIFSNKMIEMGCNLRFKDNESYNKFFQNVETVYNEGCMMKVDGASTISVNLKDGNMIYPIQGKTKLTELIIHPSVETYTIAIDTAYGEKIINFHMYQTRNDVILETMEDTIVFLKFAFDINTSKIQFTYRTQVQFAKKAKDMADGYCMAIDILNHFFKPDDESDVSADVDLLHTIKQSFQITYSFWKKISLIEDELSLSFDPKKISNIDDNIRDVEELYLLLIKKKAVRMDVKLTSTDATGITLPSHECTLKIGQEISLTFTRAISYSICEQNITIYTANLLSNAKIKEIIKTDNHTTRVLYGDTDSMPMYVSCTAHKTWNEANIESNYIMSDQERSKKYKEALSINEYYKQEIIE